MNLMQTRTPDHNNVPIGAMGEEMLRSELREIGLNPVDGCQIFKMSIERYFHFKQACHSKRDAVGRL